MKIKLLQMIFAVFVLSSCARHNNYELNKQIKSNRIASLALKGVEKIREKKLALGRNHSCVLINGRVDCWGDNSFKQSKPPFIKNAAQIAAGAYHTCALTTEGKIICWGSNSFGQTNVPKIYNPKFIFAGENHTCAANDIEVICWGNSFGESENLFKTTEGKITDATSNWSENCFTISLKNQSKNIRCFRSSDYSSIDINSSDLKDPKLKKINAGGTNLCALHNNGVTCWNTLPFESENKVEGFKKEAKAIDIAVGKNFACLLSQNNQIKCWGTNKIKDVEGKFVEIEAGDNHFCGIEQETNEVQCFSVFPEDLLNYPIQRPQFWGAKKMIVGLNYNCFLFENYFECNEYFDDTSSKIEVNQADELPVLVSGGPKHFCTLAPGDKLNCYGDPLDGRTETPRGLNNISQLTSGAKHSCLVHNSNQVACWGDNEFGQAPEKIEMLRPITHLSAGAFHTCAYDGDKITCWGDDSDNQISAIPALENVSALSSGWYHSCAIANGKISCWGDNKYGQLKVPQEMGLPVAIESGPYTTCIINSQDDIICWGLRTKSVVDFEKSYYPEVFNITFNQICALYSGNQTCF